MGTMPNKTIYSVIESRTHPFLTPLYNKLGLNELCFKSMRKLISKIKQEKPDFIAAEFFYGYGNNYAGVNLSNLDVMLYTLQRYSPDTKVIVFVDKKERQFVDKLEKILPLYAVFVMPVDQQALIKALRDPWFLKETKNKLVRMIKKPPPHFLVSLPFCFLNG